MNWEQIAGGWNQVKGKAKEKWGKLTDDDLDVLQGKRDQLVEKIQQRYGEVCRPLLIKERGEISPLSLFHQSRVSTRLMVGAGFAAPCRAGRHL